MITTTLHALVLELIASESGILPHSVGELAHAAFYAAIHSVDPALAAQMHDAQERSAFSLSPLYGFWTSPADQRIHVSVGQTGWLRIGLLDDRLFHAFIQHLLTSHSPVIRLGNLNFLISQVYGTPGSHPWVGYTTLDDLRNVHETPDHWILDFQSPTAIRWNEADNGARKFQLFPTPRIAIASLRTRWDKLTGDTWGRDFEEWVERNVVVGRIWQWRTESFRFQRQTYIGGSGVLEFKVLDRRKADHVAQLNRLLQLAFYTGIGYKTAIGLGQVRILTETPETERSNYDE